MIYGAGKAREHILGIAKAMRENGVGRIVFSSSCATYGEPGTDLISEDTPQRPTNPYGESKLMFETMLRWHAKIHGLSFMALRYFNACGATDELGEDHRVPCETHVIPLVLRVALGLAPCAKIFGDDYATPDGTCIRDYVHVTDLADAHLRAIESSATGAVNLGTGHGYSVKEIVESARRVTGHPVPAEVTPRRPGDPDKLVAKVGLAEKVLGWKASFTEIDAIVESAWKWHVKHQNGYGA